jgi:hypothetical protein
MISHDETPKTAKTTKGKLNMKRLNITFGTILLVLGCFALLPAVKAADGPPIVGLWDVHYSNGLETYDQWHSDGLEFEVGSLFPGMMCQGTWKLAANRSVQLFHVGFTFGGACPDHTDVRFEETQINTVSLDRNSYEGTYDIKYLKADGTLACEDTGTVSATRLSVH